MSEKFEGPSTEEYDETHMQCVRESDVSHTLSILRVKEEKLGMRQKPKLLKDTDKNVDTVQKPSILKKEEVKVDITTKTRKMILDYIGDEQNKLRSVHNVNILSSYTVVVTDYSNKKAYSVSKS